MRSFLLIILILPLLISCNSTRLLQKGDAAYKKGEYYKSSDYYKKAYRGLKNRYAKAETAVKMGRSYAKVNLNFKAAGAFKRAISLDFENDSALYLDYGKVLLKQGKVDEAQEAFFAHLELHPNDPLAERGLRSCAFVRDNMDSLTRYEIEKFRAFNSRESDFAPVFGNDRYDLVYFTTTRDEIESSKKNSTVTGQRYSDIYFSKLSSKGKWEKPKSIGENINTEDEEGVVSFNTRGTEIYFTKCPRNQEVDFLATIYVARRDGENWGEGSVVKVLPDSLLAAHPALSPDEQSMLFVSDIEGGFGGLDIYRIERLGSGWGIPENLGPEINTPGDEMFPHYRDDNQIYFASNGHPGFGGLDIYLAKRKIDNDKWTVENMGQPINSNADDFGICFEGDRERGFFSSGRDTYKGEDNIFRFELPELNFTLAGLVADKTTQRPLSDATVKLISDDGTLLDVKTGSNGEFRYILQPNTNYIFIASKKDYLNDRIKLTTVGKMESEELTHEFSLDPIAKPIELPNIYFDFGEFTLRESSYEALNALVQVLQANPNIVIELAAHTDMVGNDQSNLRLSQQRAQTVVDYLIEKGIQQERLRARGYGENQPKEVTAQIQGRFPFLQQGQKLTADYIDRLMNDNQKEIANQINRRTEFRVISTKYVPKTVNANTTAN